MDGLLVVDKPAGPTSHDVVARVRRVLRERRIGHTGTLDPMASGVLPLLIGRATRLARFMAASEKRYDAIVRLGVTTDSRDALGQPLGPPFSGAWPERGDVERVLAAFRGTFLQQPPAFSAKKVGGERSYTLARRSAAAGVATDDPPRLPEPVEVTAYAIEVTAYDAGRIALSLACSSGFYVRSLAHDLGQALGTGGHLEALRRTATGGVTLADAMTLDQIEQAQAPAAAVMAMDRLLPHLPAVLLSADGARKATHGQDLGPADATSGFPATVGPAAAFRLLDPAGDLRGIGERSDRPGLLHPAVILV
jgi:tRNA pseudouridine55 synthase